MKVVRIELNEEKKKELEKLLEHLQDTPFVQAVSNVETNPEEDDELNFFDGLETCMEMLYEIYYMSPQERMNVFGIKEFSGILAGGLDSLAAFSSYKTDQFFEVGDIVLFEDERCYVIKDNGGDKVTLMDNTFHNFEVERSKIKKTA